MSLSPKHRSVSVSDGAWGEIVALCEAGRFALIRRIKGEDVRPADAESEVFDNVAERLVSIGGGGESGGVECVHVFGDGSILFDDKMGWTVAADLDDLNDQTGWNASFRV